MRNRAPDPQEVSGAQTQSNIDTAVAQANLNQTNQVTPWGNLTWTQNGTNPDGTPKFTATTTLSPQQQQIFNNQQGTQQTLSGLAQTQAQGLGNTLSQPFDLSDPSIGSAIMDRYAPRFEGQRARDRSSLESSLADRGVRLGSDAYSRAISDFDKSYGDRENQLMLDARNQTIGELLTQRSQPLNEIMTMSGFGGGVQTPPFAQTPQTGVANTDVTTPVYQSYAQDQARRQAMLGGLFGLGSSLLGGWQMSDRRTKQDVKRVGKLDDGTNIFAYRYKGGMGGGLMRLGVMAQEIEHSHPEAVGDVGGGLKAVDYSTLAEDLAEEAA